VTGFGSKRGGQVWLHFLDKLNRWIEYIIILFMAIMTLIVGANVWMRYVLRTSILWSEELTIYLMIWASFLATAMAFRKGEHVAFTIIQNWLPWKVRRYVILLNQMVILTFLAVMVYYGTQYAIINWLQQTPALRISKGIPYLSIPVCGVLMILQITGVVIKNLHKFRKHNPVD
jgi:TRAP-type C4-dicarboxylate transport system permease small subunit